jgi:hypothetical protein
LHGLAEQLADDFLPDGWERVSSSSSTKVSVNRQQQLYYKEYKTRSPAESLKTSIRGSRATHSRMNSEALLFAGIDAPECIQFGKLPRSREYFFSKAAPGLGINHWLRHQLVTQTRHQLCRRRRLLRALGTFIGRVHATGFIHGNLSPDNVMVALHHERFRFTLIGNEHNSRKIPPPGKMLLRNLMELNSMPSVDLSQTDRMRFFCAWRQQMRGLSPVEAKILAAEVYQRTR